MMELTTDNSNSDIVTAYSPSTEIYSEEVDDLFPIFEPVFINTALNTITATSSTGAAAAVPLDLSQTFFLSSLPGANQTIYLDFDGHTTTGTQWNTTYTAGAAIITPAYDFDGITGSFSTAELTSIQQIWQRVTEDFSPFNVNITTKAPTDINDLIKSSTADTRWGVRVAIGGSSSDWFGAGAGGVAYLGSFNANTDTPAFVFPAQLGSGNEKYTAEAISHEVGHTLGLNHDGRTTPVESYYTGQGTGETGWATIMGVGYYQNLSQWSKGQYAAASNPEDDLQIITTENGFGYRADDAGNTISNAKSLTISGTTVSGSGIIEQNTDVDFYSFATEAGLINLNVSPAARGPNLDILAQLYSADGTLVATSNPIGGLAASISTTIATAGIYYLKIDGVGEGDPLVTGYTDYGSLGQYSISGNIIQSSLPVVSLALASTSVLEDGTPNLLYTFSRTGDITNALIVNYQVGGTANSADDYTQSGATSFTATTGTITFAAGASTTTLQIDPTADKSIESNETIALTLTTDPSYIIATTSAVTGTIVDDDFPIVTLATSPDGVLEDGSTNLLYTFSRTGDITNALTVNYQVAGTATLGTDYLQSGAASFTATTGTMTFAAGASTATLTIDPTVDKVLENNETVALTLTANSNYTVGTTTAVTGTIIDDELPVVSVALSDPSVLEDGATNAIYTFTRTGATTKVLTVNFGVSGNATFNQDYTQTGAASFRSTAGTIKFAANSATATLIVNPTADPTVEENETVILTLQKGSGYNVSTTTVATVTILNDDVAAIAPTNSFENQESELAPIAANTSPVADPRLNTVDGFTIDLTQIVAPSAKVSFSVDRDAAYNNTVGFYTALDASGAIQTSQGILMPTDAGYIQAALVNSLANALKSGLTLSTDGGNQTNLNVELNKSFYLPIIVANGTLADAANGLNLNAYTAFASANADKTEHIRSLGNGMLGFEDTFGGGDRDFNDLIIKASIG